MRASRVRRRTCLTIGRLDVWVSDVQCAPKAEATRTAFDRAVRAACRAVEGHYRPAKLNLLALDNAVPHLHAHIVPRYVTDDDPGRT